MILVIEIEKIGIFQRGRREKGVEYFKIDINKNLYEKELEKTKYFIPH